MWKKLSNLNKILVPVDLTDASLCAVEAALQLSREKKSQIYLIHVITPTPDRIGTAQGSTEAGGNEEMEKKYRAMEEFFLKKIRPQSKFAYIVRCGVPAREILTYAREEGVDVIVLPAGGPVRMGGIADQVVRNAAVPVMVVKPEAVARKLTDTSPWEIKEDNVMPYDDRYLQEIRQRVCAKCIDRTASGLCVTSTYDSCAINRYLPEIIDIVLTTPGDNLADYLAELRQRVCSVCGHQSPDGYCDMREDVECALDRYFPLVVEAIQEVKHAL
jgi:nucleotide-binding universal stress UspA family protein